jgi:hypothetical protein
LERIAAQVNDAAQFALICREIGPELGFQATSVLLGLSREFTEVESFRSRINTQIQLWGNLNGDTFLPPGTTAVELEQKLAYLETVAGDARRAEYMAYPPAGAAADDKNWHSGNALKTIVRQAFFRQQWRPTDERGQYVGVLYRRFEENVVRWHLTTIWNEVYATATGNQYKFKVRWEFDTFSAYVAYESRTQDWTDDNDRNRRYWNWREAESGERQRFFETFNPICSSLFDNFGLWEVAVIFARLPKYLSTRKIQKEVLVPVAWKRDSVIQEGYNKWVGHYTERLDVARPVDFAPHIFTFERPYLQDALDMLNRASEIRETFQSRLPPHLKMYIRPAALDSRRPVREPEDRNGLPG